MYVNERGSVRSSTTGARSSAERESPAAPESSRPAARRRPALPGRSLGDTPNNRLVIRWATPNAGTHIPTSFAPAPFTSSKTRTRQSGRWSGSGRKRTSLTTPNMATFAPMPRASVRTATLANPRLFSRLRTGYRTSCSGPASGTPAVKWRGTRAAAGAFEVRSVPQ